jgi:zinc transport system permease protein
MTEFLSELMRQGFLQHALIGGVLASIGCGIMGSYVVVKRIGFLAGGISHTVLGGMGVALFFSVSPLAGALVAALVSAILIGWISLHWREQEDTLIGAFWAIGMAIGILFISRTPGYNVDLMSYLFGNILIISSRDLWLMAGMDAVVLLMVLLFFRQFMAVAFDEEFARLRGVPVTWFYLLLLSLVALTVVLLIQVVGLILVIALLTLPAAVALQYVHSLGRSMALASLLGVVFTCVGLVIAYQSDLPAGATIILVAGVAYFLSTLLGRWRLQRTRAERSAT